MATVSPTWTSGSVIGTVLAGLCFDGSCFTISHGRGRWVSSARKKSSLQEVCREACCPLQAFYLIDLLVHENQISSSYLCKTEAVLIEILEDVFS